jgi:hypothetical protein
MPYVCQVHNDQFSWQILMDSILLDTSYGAIKLLTTMTNLNK